MKHLIDIVNEAINPSLRAKLLELIDDPDLTDKIAQNMLNTGKYTGKMGLGTGKFKDVPGIPKMVAYKDKKRSGQSYQKGWIKAPSIKEIKDVDKYGVGEWLQNIDINTSKIKEIINILVNNNAMSKYVNYLKDPWFSSSDLIHGKNIFNILKSTGIPQNTLKELAYLEDNKDNISQGKFEILLKMFLNNLNANNEDYKKGHGDIHAGGYAIEVKGDQGRAGGQKSPNCLAMYNKLRELTKPYHIKIDNDSLNSAKRISPTIKSIYDIVKDDRKVFDIIYESLLSQFNMEDSLSEDDKNKLTKDIFKNGEVLEVNDTNGITRLMLSVQLYNYWWVEKYNYLFLVDITNGNYDCIDTNKFSLMYIFYHPHIGTKNGSGGMYGKSPRENFCYIEYK